MGVSLLGQLNSTYCRYSDGEIAQSVRPEPSVVVGPHRLCSQCCWCQVHGDIYGMQHDFPVVACAPSRSHAKHTHRMLPVSYLQNAIRLIQNSTGTKKKNIRPKTYTRSMPKPARRKLANFTTLAIAVIVCAPSRSHANHQNRMLAFRSVYYISNRVLTVLLPP